MSDKEPSDKPTRSARIMLFLVLAAVIALLVITTYTCAERPAATLRGSGEPMLSDTPPAI
ncbi:hypothetical protein [Sphingomonas solaris]|uniref:Uncharacterized protein n=1 Tax=Alterirhizorhabdus solaris TaxID=2529389 RepID=A0A558RAS0_9SPHN|nr:hypothetical protein [Sphingomonas solaris]TVV76473.1 hypothetical protein FOY91_04445 [Sphingomonas solaris]